MCDPPCRACATRSPLHIHGACALSNVSHTPLRLLTPRASKGSACGRRFSLERSYSTRHVSNLRRRAADTAVRCRRRRFFLSYHHVRRRISSQCTHATSLAYLHIAGRPHDTLPHCRHSSTPPSRVRRRSRNPHDGQGVAARTRHRRRWSTAEAQSTRLPVPSSSAHMPSSVPRPPIIDGLAHAGNDADLG